MSRKPLSSRLRFEVFKRDNFTCQYCGAHPPGALLHCDHIYPVSEGGENVVENLITACQTCNLGKSNVLLASKPASLADRGAEIAEREFQIAGYEGLMRERRERLDADAQRVLEAFCESYRRSAIPMADFRSIKLFVEKLGADAVLGAVDIAALRFRYGYRTAFKYFCGVCWNMIRRGEGHGAD